MHLAQSMACVGDMPWHDLDHHPNQRFDVWVGALMKLITSEKPHWIINKLQNPLA